MNRKKIISMLVFGVLIVFLIVLWFMKKQSSEELIISGHPQWAPIMYQQDDKIIGAGPEIASKIFEELGIKVASSYEGSWDIVQKKAREGNVDFLVAAYKTEEREKYMEYSIPYTIDPVVLVMRKGNAFSYKEWDDLITKKGVVTNGDSYGEGFDGFIKKSLKVKNVDTPKEAFDLLESEQVDYFVYALYSTKDYIFQNNVADTFEIAPDYISAENFYFTFSKKSSFLKLLPKFNTILKKYQEEGIIDKIIEKNKQLLWGESS